MASTVSDPRSFSQVASSLKSREILANAFKCSVPADLGASNMKMRSNGTFVDGFEINRFLELRKDAAKLAQLIKFPMGNRYTRTDAGCSQLFAFKQHIEYRPLLQFRDLRRLLGRAPEGLASYWTPADSESRFST